MVVTRVNHGDRIIQIGDVKNIDEDKIEHLLPIDLILAASPCNDLSLANPQRKGIFGNVRHSPFHVSTARYLQISPVAACCSSSSFES